MEQTINVDEIPSQAYRLYIKLYCERKGVKDKKTTEEAKKSWIALSLTKKKHFYKTSAKIDLVKHAHTLCKTEAYLKEKNPKRPRLDEPQSNEVQDEDHTTDAAAISINDTNITENTLHESMRDDAMECDASIQLVDNQYCNETEVADKQETQSNVDSDEASTVLIRLDESAPPTINNETMSLDGRDTHSNADSTAASTVPIRLNEPTPPTVKIGKDLYEMISKPGSKSWNELNRAEKEHYNIAVRAIKREYIKNYTLYLESLSQQELFDHYMKTLH